MGHTLKFLFCLLGIVRMEAPVFIINAICFIILDDYEQNTCLYLYIYKKSIVFISDAFVLRFYFRGFLLCKT